MLSSPCGARRPKDRWWKSLVVALGWIARKAKMKNFIIKIITFITGSKPRKLKVLEGTHKNYLGRLVRPALLSLTCTRKKVLSILLFFCYIFVLLRILGRPLYFKFKIVYENLY